MTRREAGATARSSLRPAADRAAQAGQPQRPRQSLIERPTLRLLPGNPSVRLNSRESWPRARVHATPERQRRNWPFCAAQPLSARPRTSSAYSAVYVRRVLGQGRGSPTVKRGPIAGERTWLRAHKQAPERVRDGVSRVCQLERPPLLLMSQRCASAAVRMSPSYLV